MIRELEKTRYALFLRPRRFGKSLLGIPNLTVGEFMHDFVKLARGV